MALLDTNSQAILNTFQNAYLNQIGSKMTVGSEEYTLSQIFTYVMAVYAAMVNASYNNRFIDTASGTFLDSIASQYNLSRTKATLGNPYFEGKFYFQSDYITGLTYSVGEYTFTVAGITFSNAFQFTLTSDPVYMRWETTDAVQDEITIDQLKDALVGTDKRFTTNSVFIHQVNSTTYEMDDDEFRQYIKDNMFLYTAGKAESFVSAVTLGESGSIVGASVQTHEDNSNIPVGEVQVLLRPRDAFWDLAVLTDPPTSPSDVTPLHSGLLKVAESVISDCNITVIGQTVNAYYGSKLSARPEVGYVYVSKSSGITEAMLNSKMQYIINYWNNRKLNIGQKLIPSELIDAMMHPLSNLSSVASDFDASSMDEITALDAVNIIGSGGRVTYVLTPGSDSYYNLESVDYMVMYI